MANGADKVGVNIGNTAGSKSIHKLVFVMGSRGNTLFHRRFLGR